MLTVEGDIVRLNMHLCMLQDSLLQHGRECSDILINMITAYHLFQIRDFQEYMMLEYSFYIGGKGDFEVDK